MWRIASLTVATSTAVIVTRRRHAKATLMPTHARQKQSRPKIIGITGRKGHGKDTIANHLCQKYGYTRVAFADPLKDACGVLFGLDHEQLHGAHKEKPDPEWFGLTPRKILQFVGTNLFRTHMTELSQEFKDEFWVLCAKRKIKGMLMKDESLLIVISDVRFYNECKMIEELGGINIRVVRDDAQPVDMHESEREIANLPVAHEVSNIGSIAMLHSQIDEFMQAKKG